MGILRSDCVQAAAVKMESRLAKNWFVVWNAVWCVACAADLESVRHAAEENSIELDTCFAYVPAFLKLQL
jgi:hypothetical protein